MKTLFIGIGIAICAMFDTTDPAQAYSEEMAQIAQVINAELKNDPDLEKVEYDGTNLVFTMKPSEEYNVLSLFAGKEREAMLKAMMLSGLTENQEEGEMMKQIMKQFKTGLKFRIPIDNKIEELVITPEEL